MIFCVAMSVFLLGACALDKEKNAADRTPESDVYAGEEGSGNAVFGENGQQSGLADDEEVQPQPENEEISSQPENEPLQQSEQEESFFGSWQVTDYRTSRIYAMSQEEIDEFLTYGLAYYEDAFFLNGTPVEAEGFGYVYTDYTKEEVEEQFNVDMTGWWNESDTIVYAGITSVESDGNPSLQYCFGTAFFVVDADTIWIYYEGVFFQAKRAGA